MPRITKRLTHQNLETFPKTPVYSRKNFEMGWTSIAMKLEQFLEGKISTP